MSENNNEICTPEILILNGYRYIDQLGEGANGKTYRAKNLKTGEIVAIKALKFCDNLKNYELFAREAEALKSIHSSGVPEFYDFITGEGEFTECWLVQEYIPGESILEKLENNESFDELKTIEIVAEVAEIIHELQTVYTPPIIHRDIKPSNILVRQIPKNGHRLCLIDFGAVANPQRRGVNSTVAGTVGYMAPEQLIGDCSIQSDYYALGATALHMLTGKPPSEFPSNGFVLHFEDELIKCCPKISEETINILRTLLSSQCEDRPENSEKLMSLFKKQQLTLSKELYKYGKRVLYYEKNFFKIMFNRFLLSCFFSVGISACLIVLLDNIIWRAFEPGVVYVWVLILFTFIFFLITFARYQRMLSKLPAIYQENPLLLEQLPDLSCEIEKHHDDSDGLIVTGRIASITKNVMEYTFTVDHESYGGVYIIPDSQKDRFKVGDSVNVKYDHQQEMYSYLLFD